MSEDTTELPDSIRELVARCEINEVSFTNDEMSTALAHGQLLHDRIVELIDDYEEFPEDVDSRTSVIANRLTEVLQDALKGRQR